MDFPFFYNYTSEKNHKTAETVHAILKNHFTNGPSGLPGNDDAGALSAWVVFAMMEIYPDTPGKPEYLVTSPVLDKIKIKLNSKFYTGNEIMIERKGPVNGKIIKMTLNGKDLDYSVDHFELTSHDNHLLIITQL